VWRAFFTHVFSEVRGWQCFSLEGLDADLVAAPEFQDVLHRRGVVVDRAAWAHWSLRFDGTWHAFLNTRSANFRRNLKRAVGRWEAMGAPAYCRVDPLSLKALEELDARSWRMAKPQDVQKNTWLLAYCRQLMRIFPDPSVHVIRLLLLDGTPIAGVYGFRWGDALYGYKITYDQAYEACSPGTVLFAKLFEECQQAGIARIELIGRNEYLERWANERREISRTLVFHRRNLGLAWGWACRAATALKGRRRPDAEVAPP
jgi:CelD/BcsL family acetyltransferase involved in cellulose biosynthesis